MTGIWVIPNEEHADSLFNALLLEIAVISVASFGLYLKNEMKSPTKVTKNPESNVKDTKAPSKHNISTPKAIDNDSNAIKLKNADLLAIKGKQGIAVVKIENDSNGAAKYHWRFKGKSDSNETSGSGELYEQYGKINNSGFVEDVGGKLHLSAGPFELEWSCSSNNCCWVYKCEAFSLSIFENMELDSFRLS